MKQNECPTTGSTLRAASGATVTHDVGHERLMIKESEYAILSVMGPHAGQDEAAIFSRKIADIHNIGITYWLIHSYKAKPNIVQHICGKASGQDANVRSYFLAPSSPGGASPTLHCVAANEYSSDNTNWVALPQGLSPVTGHINRSAVALVFGELHIEATSTLDLWQYSDGLDPEQPIIIRQGASTICALRKDMTHHPARIKSHSRRVVAVGTLTKPYAVWLK